MSPNWPALLGAALMALASTFTLIFILAAPQKEDIFIKLDTELRKLYKLTKIFIVLVPILVCCIVFFWMLQTFPVNPFYIIGELISPIVIPYAPVITWFNLVIPSEIRPVLIIVFAILAITLIYTLFAIVFIVISVILMWAALGAKEGYEVIKRLGSHPETHRNYLRTVGILFVTGFLCFIYAALQPASPHPVPLPFGVKWLSP